MKHDVSPYFFYFFAAVSILPGIFVLASKDIVRAAFWLLLALSGFAGLYVLLGADFLAVTQVVVYLGGILILILFGVMLTHRDPALVRRARRLNIVVPGIAGGVVLAFAVVAAVTRAHFATTAMTLTEVSPSSGSVAGGTKITLTGTNFATVTSISLGDLPLENVEVTDTKITGTTNPASFLSKTDAEDELKAEQEERAAKEPAKKEEAREKRKNHFVDLVLRSPGLGTLVARNAFDYGPQKAAPVFARSSPAELFKGTTAELGTLLVAESEDHRSFLLPFEIASVLLLGALVGAAYIARRGGEHEQYDDIEEGHLHG